MADFIFDNPKLLSKLLLGDQSNFLGSQPHFFRDLYLRNSHSTGVVWNPSRVPLIIQSASLEPNRNFITNRDAETHESEQENILRMFTEFFGNFHCAGLMEEIKKIGDDECLAIPLPNETQAKQFYPNEGYCSKNKTTEEMNSSFYIDLNVFIHNFNKLDANGQVNFVYLVWKNVITNMVLDTFASTINSIHENALGGHNENLIPSNESEVTGNVDLQTMENVRTIYIESLEWAKNEFPLLFNGSRKENFFNLHESTFYAILDLFEKLDGMKNENGEAVLKRTDEFNNALKEFKNDIERQKERMIAIDTTYAKQLEKLSSLNETLNKMGDENLSRKRINELTIERKEKLRALLEDTQLSAAECAEVSKKMVNPLYIENQIKRREKVIENNKIRTTLIEKAKEGVNVNIDRNLISEQSSLENNNIITQKNEIGIEKTTFINENKEVVVQNNNTGIIAKYNHDGKKEYFKSSNGKLISMHKNKEANHKWRIKKWNVENKQVEVINKVRFTKNGGMERFLYGYWLFAETRIENDLKEVENMKRKLLSKKYTDRRFSTLSRNIGTMEDKKLLHTTQNFTEGRIITRERVIEA